jgi:hypothetical protein
MANWKTRFNELSERKLIPPKLIRILTVLGCALVMAAPSVDAFAKNSNSSKNHIAVMCELLLVDAETRLGSKQL